MATRFLLFCCLLLGSACAQVTSINGVNPLPAGQTFTPVSPLLINDSLGHHWAVTMDDFGILHNAPTALVPTTTYRLDSSSTQASFTLGITTGGMLTTTQVVFTSGLPTTLAFLTTHGHSSFLFCAAGILTSTTPQ